MIEMTTTSALLMAGVFIVVAAIFVVCIRRELK